ncbi:hypothetical protein OHA53_19645 [Streptomyces althioticus]|uniref:hypothetical protein n=1 Tax=Streptomyces althioticus TaxID=83380 RepID=UPI00387319D8|nr:hypothetical protein OHA53_19645 [Streptomyces althioticus]
MTLRAEDNDHVEDFAWAMPQVVARGNDRTLDLMTVYGRVQDRLKAAGRPSMSVGTFRRLCRATGLSVTAPDSLGYRFFNGLRLLSDDD